MASRRRPDMGARIDDAPAATITPIDRGRDAFTAEAPPAAGEPMEIATSLIDPSPDNPRSSIGDVSDLAASIEAVGIIAPLLVTPAGDRFALVYGHRRLAAAKRLQLATVPAVVSADADPRRVRAKRLVENVQREDLSPLDEARGYQELLDLGVEGGQRGLARLVGKSQGHISKRLGLLRLPPEVQAKVDSGGISLTDAVELGKLVDEPERVAKAVKEAERPYSGGLAETVKRQVQEAKHRAAMEAEAAALRAAGVTVLEGARHYSRQDGPFPLNHFMHSAEDREAHATLACHAAMATSYGSHLELVCLDPQAHLRAADDARAEQQAIEAAERARLEEADEAATQARRAFVEALVRKGSPDAGASLLVGQMVGGRHYYLRVEDSDLASLLGLAPDTFNGKRPAAAIEAYVAKGTRNAQRAVYAAGVLLGEAALSSYDTVGARRAYFAHLTGRGYQLSAVEQHLLDEDEDEDPDGDDLKDEGDQS